MSRRRNADLRDPLVLRSERNRTRNAAVSSRGGQTGGDAEGGTPSGQVKGDSMRGVDRLVELTEDLAVEGVRKAGVLLHGTDRVDSPISTPPAVLAASPGSPPGADL
jgi:hypothetical protein